MSRREDESRARRAVAAENNRCGCRLAVAAFAILAIQSGSAGTVVGRINGDFTVNARGAATYQIPINVAAGARGLKPDIALSYSSQGGDGWVGVGWALSGFSRVERCGKTIPLDSQRQGVTFTTQDRFCLDGQPLVQVSSGSYGGNGVEYRTELHNYERIKSYGPANGPPTSFTVERPNGLTYLYGASEDSRIEIYNSTAVKVWALNLIQDKSGNAIRYTYHEYSYEYAPDQITWTEKGAQTGRYSLTFTFDSTRLDARRGYVYGAEWWHDRLLRTITYKFDTSVVHKYELDYATSGNAGSTQRSKLVSVLQCGPGASPDCLPATTFAWQLGAAGWSNAGGGPTTDKGWLPQALYDMAAFGDFDGDGDTDVLVPHPGSSPYWHLLRANDGSFGTAPENTGFPTFRYSGTMGGGPAPPTPAAIAMEFDGDGFSDVLVLDNSGYGLSWKVYRSTGHPTSATALFEQTPYETGIVPGETTDVMTALDMDGDGLDDVVYNQSGVSTCYFRRNTGAAFGPPTPCGFPGGNPYTHKGFRQADVNGDGRADLIFFKEVVRYGGGPIEIRLAEGAGFATTAYWSSASSFFKVLTPDINGDGLTDLLLYAAEGSWRARRSRGSPSSPMTSEAVTGIPGTSTETIADYDGDGRDDVIVYVPGSGWRVYLSDGETYSSYQAINGPYGSMGARAYALDVNADGARDLVFSVHTADNTQWVVGTHALGADGTPADVVKRIDDGLDNYFNLVYKPLSSSLVYAIDGSFDLPSPPTGLYNRMIRGSPFHILQQYTTNDGIGGSYSRTYQYRNARRNTQGRGFLGFTYVFVNDSRPGQMSSSTRYDQNFPFTGRIIEQRNLDDETGYVTLGLSTSTWQQDPKTSSYDPGTSKTYQFVYPQQNITKDYNSSGGAEFRTTTRTLTYSPTTGLAHGTPDVDSTSISAGGNTWTTTRTFTFDNDTKDSDTWCLGLPTAINEFRSGPDEPSGQTRTVTSDYSEIHCSKQWEIIAGTASVPASQQLKTSYSVNGYGNVTNLYQASAFGDYQREIRFEYDTSGYRVTADKLIVEAEVTTCNGTTPAVTLDTFHSWKYGLGLEETRSTPDGRSTTWTYDDFGRLKKEDLTNDSSESNFTYTSCSGCFVANGNARYKVNRTLAAAIDDFAEATYHDSYGRLVGRTRVLLDGTTSQEVLQWDPLESTCRHASLSIL